jgi:uncharacterized membrane protein SpoIIM required for sporulation
VDLDAYVAENAPQWRRLEGLARRGGLSMAEVDELVELYQRVGAQLSVIRGQAPDPMVVSWLSRVLMLARGRLTSGRSGSAGHGFGWFFSTGFPLVVYQARRWWITIGLVNVAAYALLIDYLQARPALLDKFTGQTLSVQDVKGYYSEYPAEHFALQVWTHNALLTALVLAGGILLVPVPYLLFDNALNIGLDGGYMFNQGYGKEFLVLILPHGLLELTSLFIAAGVGMRMGWAWVAPPTGLTRGRALGEAARAAMLASLGLGLSLGVSGLIEAFVTPSELSAPVRIGIGVVVWLAFLSYVLVLGRRAELADRSADVDPSLRAATVAAI